MNIDDDKTGNQVGRIDVDETVSSETDADLELFDSYSDDGFVEDTVPVKKKGNSGKSVLYAGAAVAVIAVAGGYFMLPGGNNVKPGLPQIPGAPPVVAEQNTKTPITGENTSGNVKEVKFPSEGILKNPEAMDGISSDTAAGNNKIDYGQPPAPAPVNSEKFAGVNPDSLAMKIDNSVQADNASTDQTQNPPAGSDTVSPTSQAGMPVPQEIKPSDTVEKNDGRLPLPGNLSELESSAKEIPAAPSVEMPVPVNEKKIEILQQENIAVEAVSADKVPAKEPADEAHSDTKQPDITALPTPDAAEDKKISETTPDTAVPVNGTDIPGQKSGISSENEKIVTVPQEETQTSDVSGGETVTQDIEKPADTSFNKIQDAVQTENKTTAEEKTVSETKAAPVVVKEEKKVYRKSVTPHAKEPAVSAETAVKKYVLRSAQMGVAWVAEIGGNGDMQRVAEGKHFPGLGVVRRIAPVNGRWIIEGETGKIVQ